MKDLQKKFGEEFENLAQRILEQKSEKFTQENKKHIAHIGIVMLARMHNHFLNIRTRLLLTKNLTTDRPGLNKLRARA
jgi:hypothetical protein